MKSKLLKILSIAGMSLGLLLLSKGCIEDSKYETRMIQEGKEKVLYADGRRGVFHDKNNNYEYAGGWGILMLSLYGLSKSGSKQKTKSP